ncbi:MAG TPA: class I SAM-dependent methyltransferase [Candidatus Binataceae bacterium]|nr:class I SAM-dependent methyltransferase [Candidatus Binataceae bacterium]
MKLEEMPASEVARYWDENAERWAADVRAGWDAYREYYNNPAFFEFVGDLSGRDVLDAGCGEGYNTRLFASRGAHMTGIDLSARMIELAREEEHRAPLGIRYEIASFTDLPVFADESFDAVISTMALMDGPDFPAALRELYRVLRRGGRPAFSILHPCFLTRGFSWITDNEGGLRLTIGGYFNAGSWVERWRFSSAARQLQAAPFAIPRFDRMLSDYVNGVIEAGLVLNGIAEPRPSEEACVKHSSLRNWRDTAPTFLYIRATKP